MSFVPRKRTAAAKAATRRPSCQVIEQLEQRTLLTTWYVDNGSGGTGVTGSDGNTGTALTVSGTAGPFRTISKAASVAVAGDTIAVRKGTYRETVSPKNSGTSTSRVVYQPYNGERVIVNGTDAVTGWTRVGSTNVYSATMSWNFTSNYQSNQVFAGGKMLNLARWPSETNGDLVVNPHEATIDSVSVASNNDVTITDAAFTDPGARWVGAKIWLNLSRNGYDGQGQTGTVKAVTGNRITVTGVETRTGNQPWGIGQGTKYYLFNPTGSALRDAAGAASAVDRGEWWYDATNKKLYVHLLDGAAPSATAGSTNYVEAKRRSFGFDLSGKRYVAVREFNLFGTSLTTDNAGDQRTNGGTRGGNVAPANNLLIDGVKASYVTHFTDLAGNYQMQWLQQSGLQVSGTNITLRNSTVRYSAGSGVSVFGKNNKVLNNVIHDTNYQVTEAGALNTGRTYAPGEVTSWDHEIGNNTIFNSPQQGINFRALKNSANSSTDLRARIHHNTIHDVMLRSFDSGAIDQFGTDGQWVRIDHNVIYNIPGDTNFGIYIDYGLGYVIDHNLVYDVRYPIYSNWESSSGSNHKMLIHNNTALSDLPTINGILNGKGYSPGVTARNNISTKGVNLGTNAAVSNNLAAADSLFAAPATANYRLSTSGRGAIDAGTSVGPLDDARADGPDADATAQPDIGAFEYGARAWTAGSTKLAAPKAVVTGLTVAAPSAGRRDLRWTDISGETGYVVQRSSTNGSFWEEAVRLPANTTSYADVGLKGGKYLYRVRGLSDALAAYSRPASASARVAGTTFPASSFDATGGGSAPLTVFGDNIGNSSPNAYARYNNVDFGAAGSITRFYATIATGSGGNHIYVRLDNPTTGTTIADLTTASTGGFGTYNEQSAGVSAAARGVRDVYIVFSNWGTANMNSFRFTPTAPLAINAPAQVGGLTARAASSTQVNLSWTDLSGESNYKVERSTDNLFWAHIGHTAAGVTTYSDTGRTASTKYYYRVLAVNAAGDSQRSYSANATTPSATVTGAFSGSQTAASAAKLDTGDSTVGYPLGYRILTSDTDADWNSQKAIKTGAGSSAITEIDLLT